MVTFADRNSEAPANYWHNAAGTEASMAGGGLGVRAGIDQGTMRAIRLWCRHRADHKIQRVHDMEPYWLKRTPHEEVRYQLGLTVDEYRRARRWLDAAVDRCTESQEHLQVYEAVRAIADEHIDLVTRYGILREEQGLGFEEIREHLGVSERTLDLVAEWWRDALAAVKERRGPDRD